MNVYAVCIPEWRTSYDYYQIDPPETGIPMDLFIAETSAQAKADALRLWAQESGSGVYSDDWPRLRCRVIVHNIRRPRGRVKTTDTLWRLWPRDWPNMEGKKTD